MPKKPITAYVLFSQDSAQREKAVAVLKEAGVEAGTKQLASKLGELWKAASAEEKALFEERHKREHEEFLQKQKDWQATPECREIEAAASKEAEQKKFAGEVAIDTDVLTEAGKVGLEAMLRNLAARAEVAATGKSSRELFDALKTSGGLVNAAKRALIVGGA